jgi:hypothetical protein
MEKAKVKIDTFLKEVYIFLPFLAPTLQKGLKGLNKAFSQNVQLRYQILC